MLQLGRVEQRKRPWRKPENCLFVSRKLINTFFLMKAVSYKIRSLSCAELFFCVESGDCHFTSYLIH